MAEKKTARYRVLAHTSVRASLAPDSPDYEQWLEYPPGALVVEADLPKHADLKGFLDSADPRWEVVTDG